MKLTKSISVKHIVVLYKEQVNKIMELLFDYFQLIFIERSEKPMILQYYA
ncbi:hypothetical protein J6TS1_32730 [Siminovitchia terrae]|uniref:Uncharacterized protein n=1 Tax=Siminovitchia terrae TaxID=1914933 RepID=A0ABQ4KZE4_SIMTE|nr:hypothetical protein [Siminovitchia terrae]GIN92562.1 hypothetical protein J22TS1_36130 [Siminovitchia terrae]GIN97403.1 hypothetical protein J6TS1_32730 [Siminovitchia terrae]